MSRGVWALALVAVVAGCDRFDPPAAVEPTAAERAAEKARGAVREATAKVMKAAQAATASCVAGELRWEADPDGLAVARHYSRPCIPERCAPAPGDVDALRTSVRAVKTLVEAEPSLHVPSFQGFVALAEAMVGFADTVLAGTAKESERAARMSGLSMHYGALAAAYGALDKEAGASVPLEPPSLTASLAVATPGGDPCKGWAAPQYCDVRAVRVPAERRWRSDPPCLEVEGVKK